jgi:hypothetical protein
VRTMARFKRKRGGSRKAKSIPIAIALPVAAPAIQTGKYIMNGDMPNAMYIWTGIDSQGKLQGKQLAKTYVPIAAGVVIHKVANRVGVNNFVRRVSMGYLSI